MIVADTTVVSELMKDRPDPGVFAWAGALEEGDVTISVVTVQDIEHGLSRLPRGAVSAA